MAPHWKLATIRRRFIQCCPVKSSLAILCSFFTVHICLLFFDYPVNLCPYLWLPCHSVFLSLATMSFCIIIPGYPVMLYLISGFPAILYSSLWLPWHSVFLSLATMSFCILIPGYHVILYSYPWLPCFLASGRFVILFPYIQLPIHFRIFISGYPVICSIFPATLLFGISNSGYPAILFLYI